MWVFTELADAFDEIRRSNHKFLTQEWDENWDAYMAAHGDDPAYMTALHNIVLSFDQALIATAFVANDGAGTVSSGFLDVLRIGDGVKKGGWGYAQDALRLLMLVGPALKLGGFARVGIGRLLQVDPGGDICSWIAARAALMLTGVRHYISLGKVLEAVGTTTVANAASAESYVAFLKTVLEGFGADVSTARSAGSTIEDTLVKTLGSTPNTTAVFSVWWADKVAVTDIFGVTTLQDVVKGHTMVATLDATSSALKIFDRSRKLAYASLAAIEAAFPTYGPISKAVFYGFDETLLLVKNSAIVNILENGLPWAMDASTAAGTVNSIEHIFTYVDPGTNARFSDPSWVKDAIALEVKSVPFRVETHAAVHVPLRAAITKDMLIPQKTHWQRDLFSDGVKMGWMTVDDDYRSYTVRPGDTLSELAKVAYGDARLWRWIAYTNGISEKDVDMLQPGTVLRLEPLDLSSRLSQPIPLMFNASGGWTRQDDK